MDEAIQYKTKYHEVEQIIENTKKIGFDTKEYENILHEIDINIKEYDVNLSFFNKLILEDISKLDLSDKEREYISTKIYELDMHGITSNYFDLELIKLLLSEDEKTNFKNSILNRLKELEDKITNNNSELSNLYRDVISSKTKTEESKSKYKTAKKNLIKKLVSTALTFSVIITGGIGIERLARKLSKDDCYLKQTEIYSSLDDTTTLNKEEKIWAITPEQQNGFVYVREYEPWEKNLTGISRDYKEYNVSHIDLDTAYDYYQYGLENFGVDYNSGTETINDRVTTMEDLILYQDNYIEVEKTVYVYVGKDLYKFPYAIELIFMYTLYVAILCIVSAAIYDNTDYFDNTIRELITNFKNIKGNYQQYYHELQNEVNRLMELINSNEEYRNKFNELYEQNKYLLDNPEELYERINNLTMNQYVVDSKKLIRELKEKNNY